MRLNHGAPVWHASTSAQDPNRGKLQLPDITEKAAIIALAGIGGDHEWWIFTTGRVGHLRVPLTPAEVAALPHGVAEDDAGESGPQRPRTPAPGARP